MRPGINFAVESVRLAVVKPVMHLPELQGEPIWKWAGRNLSAATERLLSAADRIESTSQQFSD